MKLTQLRSFIPVILILILSGCKSETDKLIDEYIILVDQYEDLVTDGVDKNRDAINKLGMEIGETIDSIGTKEISEAQQHKISVATIRLQVSLLTVQEDIYKNSDKELDKIEEGLDSLGKAMGIIDSI
ncbi:MAG: hypothetical protein ACHQFW_07180 [Chitinophagales bacterium]